MNRILMMVTILLSTGCPSADSYQWQAFQLDGGCIVLFHCKMNDYSKESERQAALLAKRVLMSDLPVRAGGKYATAEVLRTGFSEGHQADVLVVVGTSEFVDQWKAKGAEQAGYAIADLRQKRAPIIVYRGKFSRSE